MFINYWVHTETNYEREDENSYGTKLKPEPRDTSIFI